MVRRWVPVLALGGLWWWAVLRLALQPEQAGVVEGAVAAGGWGLSLLPVHVASVASGVFGGASGGAGEPVGRAGPGERERDSRAGPGRLASAPGRLVAAPERLVAGLTRAWRRRRSGGGSARS
ncbi:hypothetical protein F5983_14285 [Streptomyces arboris]|uniref:Uncharacterized protein n=1 Tax=Streptomyces arboris TaxID=2600619 RepID=A0A5N5ELY5_9ACTN|nr:hypothetical protein [Streptomyces arboris]KAB2591989.1 hypothetical protein F5983_14285 [Streptomyces arboris]